MSDWFIFIPLGAFVGLLSGLFGIGGGVVMVPALIILLQKIGISEDQTIVIASRTSLAVILFTSLAAACFHHKKQSIIGSHFKELILFVITGTILGAFLVHMISPQYLKLFLMIYIFFIGLKMWFGFKPKKSTQKHKGSHLLNFIVGNIIGLKSSLLGIGGGTITIPYLVWQNVSMQKAAGISAAIGFIIALTGTSTELIQASRDIFAKERFVGSIYLPALLGILSTSILFSRLGTKLNHHLPQAKMRKGFALLLLALSAKNLYEFIA